MRKSSENGKYTYFAEILEESDSSLKKRFRITKKMLKNKTSRRRSKRIAERMSTLSSHTSQSSAKTFESANARYVEQVEMSVFNQEEALNAVEVNSEGNESTSRLGQNFQSVTEFATGSNFFPADNISCRCSNSETISCTCENAVKIKVEEDAGTTDDACMDIDMAAVHIKMEELSDAETVTYQYEPDDDWLPSDFNEAGDDAMATDLNGFGGHEDAAPPAYEPVSRQNGDVSTTHSVPKVADELLADDTQKFAGQQNRRKKRRSASRPRKRKQSFARAKGTGRCKDADAKSETKSTGKKKCVVDDDVVYLYTVTRLPEFIDLTDETSDNPRQNTSSTAASNGNATYPDSSVSSVQPSSSRFTPIHRRHLPVRGVANQQVNTNYRCVASSRYPTRQQRSNVTNAGAVNIYCSNSDGPNIIFLNKNISFRMSSIHHF